MKKKLLTGLLILITGLVTACSGKGGAKYQEYVKALIDANYLGHFDEYVDITDADPKDADALYQANVQRLADNLSRYYGISPEDDSELRSRFNATAKAIYEKTSFETAPVRTEEGVSYVDVTIHPIDLLNSTRDKVEALISDLDKRVDEGEFNDTEKEEYRRLLINGILDILDESVSSMTYKDPVTVTVRIITGKSAYYISDADFQSIDAAIIATSENPEVSETE